MATSKATRKVRRWAVRMLGGGSPYAVVIGPRKPYRRGSKWLGLGYSGMGTEPYRMPAYMYERLFPEQFHLKPGGGPVEIEFKET